MIGLEPKYSKDIWQTYKIKRTDADQACLFVSEIETPTQSENIMLWKRAFASPTTGQKFDDAMATLVKILDGALITGTSRKGYTTFCDFLSNSNDYLNKPNGFYEI